MMMIVENPEQKQFSDFVNTIHRQFDKGGTVIYQQRNEIRVFEVNNLLINVKKFKIPNLFNRVVYTFFRKSKAQRSYMYAFKLKAMGIETPEPVAYILTKRGGLLQYSYYISRQVDYNRNLYEFGEGGIEGREHILDAFAGFTASIHEKGIFHKDYSPGNILFKVENGKVEFCIVDINRMRFGKVSVLQGCLNFVRLWGQKPFFDRVIRRYAELRHANPDKCMKTVWQARKKFWKRYTRKHPMPFVWD